jgi:asparagine synthase (glutamine-hydrolysing)
LTLARDFLGQRPLHFHRNEGFFAFASMPKGLHVFEEIPRTPDQAKMAEFLALLPERGTSTFFESVERVPPGHLCTVTPTGQSIRRYWQPSPRPLILGRAEEYQEALREQFDRAVVARLRGAGPGLGTHLSGGLDSSTVTATAARLVGASTRLTAFTAVPRDGYAGDVPSGRFGDEGPNAGKLAERYPNIEHVLVRSGGKSPLSSLDRNFFLFERPILNLCNGVWIEGILDAARERGVSVLLTGQKGNMSFSYGGMEALPRLLARGRLVRLARHAVELRRHGVSLESFAAHAIGPYLPRWLWRGVNRLRGRHFGLADYSAIDPASGEFISAEAREAGLDFSYRPRRDPLEARLWVLRRTDLGNYNKAMVAGWRIDARDPTADRRLIEMCLAIPAEQYLVGGARGLARAAFSDRLPSTVVSDHRKGLQAIDWHEGLSAARGEAGEELERIAGANGAASALDLKMLRNLLQDWPTGGWNSNRVTGRYRLALLRGLSGGHFIRKASGSNG